MPASRLSVSATDLPVPGTNLETEMVDQPFAASEIGESMDADLLPELCAHRGVHGGATSGGK